MEPENRHRRHHLILHTCEVSSRGELSSQLLNDSIPPLTLLTPPPPALS